MATSMCVTPSFFACQNSGAPDTDTMTRRSELALTALLFLLPCVAVLERCAADGSLFALHPALNALAMLVCLPSALQAMLLRKGETNHAKRVWLTKLHLLLNVAAGVLVAATGAAAFVAKRGNDQQHLATPHSWAALVTGMFFALNVFQGLLLTFEGETANWHWKDETHALTGVLVYVGGVATMLYGLHTSDWGAKNFSPERQFQLTVLVIAAHVTLLGKSLVLQRRESQGRLHKADKPIRQPKGPTRLSICVYARSFRPKVSRFRSLIIL
ncbi:hypothetical protein PF008_g16071 [Phytophthora fragariae]|uniref:Cytochrome b561 domain-containing protein n=1 Tax=Phytophthora fragariae TaxID=53985 RepID=A0A6G0RC97_9STRA|nr:hypothetical protein PF008_g16071 [Phytophthora fragariae]